MSFSATCKALISLVECGTAEAVPFVGLVGCGGAEAVPFVPALFSAAFRAPYPSLVLKENAHAS